MTSTARQDSGLFELNFRDERYLPFEGTGAISRWNVELSQDTNAFDTATVSDVILHLHYTARDGGPDLRDAASSAARQKIDRGIRLVDARADFAAEWARFKHPEAGHGPTLLLPIGESQFPFHRPSDLISIVSVEVIGAIDDKTAATIPFTVAIGAKHVDVSLREGSGPGALRSQGKQIGTRLAPITVTCTDAAVSAIEELLLICHYELQAGGG